MRVASCGGRHEDHATQHDRQHEHDQNRQDEGHALLVAMQATPRPVDTASIQVARPHTGRLL
jgi:hypothetical protein